MRWNKTWFCYLLWGCYAVITGIALSLCSIYLCRVKGVDDIRVIIGITSLLFAMVGVLYWIGSRTGRYVRTHNRITKSSQGRIEYICFMLLIIAGIGIRLYLLRETVIGDIQGIHYYEAAAVQRGHSLEPVAHVGNRFYIALLWIVFSFVGNKITAGIVLQIVLQIGLVLFLYFAIKMLAGNIPAMCTAGCMLFVPWEIEYALSYSPRMLYGFLFSLGIWGIALYITRSRKQQDTGFLAYLARFFLGVYLAVVIYTDFSGIILLVFLFGSLFLKDGDNRTWKPFMTVLAGGILSFCGIFFLEYYLTGVSFIDCLFRWFSLYTGKIAWQESILFDIVAMVQEYMVFALLLCMALVLLIPGFVFSGKTEKFSLWFIAGSLCLGMAAFQCTYDDMFCQQLAWIFIWVLAGIGIQSTLAGADEEQLQLEVESMHLEQDHQKQDVSEEHAENQNQQEDNKIEYIKNPLPGPKKHVKRTMTYGFEPKESEMKYDVPVNEDDDFDFRL